MRLVHGQRYKFTDTPINFVQRSCRRRQGLAGLVYDKAMTTAQRLAAMNARHREFWKEKR